MTPIIETRDLTNHYGETIGLEGLDLRIEQGEVFGFLGPNGAIFYWLDFMAELWAPLKALDWINPCTYFDPIPAAVIQGTPMEHPLLLLAVFVAGTVAARWQFERAGSRWCRASPDFHYMSSYMSF